MNLDFTRFSNILSSFYTDAFDFYTTAKSTNPDGTTKVKVDLEPIQLNVPCRLSFETEDNPNSITEDINPVRLNVKIFCASDIPVSKGDKIIAYKKDGLGNVVKTYTGIANLPLTYETHLEIGISKVGEA